ncbi:hypothetical protein F4804DRAFT_85437 [Jackrogersella minutella]|nr:hypothetical protein F4804DRAFT_85437 [Jackrogersella minutella]
MEYEPLAPKPQPVYGQGFWYNGMLTVKGIPRVEPQEIKRLIFEPKGLDPSAQHEWRSEALKTVTKTWLEAQARHYGVMLGSKDNYQKNELQDLLRRESLQPDFGDLQRQFNAFTPGQFEKMKANWEAQCEAYMESCFSGRRQEDFDNLATLEEKLNFDIDLFIATYYSDRETLPTPISFRGINFDLVMDEFAKVPDLYAQKVGTDFQKMLWVGWDKKEVKEACKRYAKLAKENAAVRRLLKEKHKVLAQEKKQGKVLAWRLEPHRDYVAKQNRNRGIDGSYVVEATFNMGLTRDPESQWMDIRNTDLPGVYEATFNFMPAVEGVMILSENDEDLQKYNDQFEPPKTVQATTVGMQDTTRDGSQPGSKRKRRQTGDEEQSRADGSSHSHNAKRMRPDMPEVASGLTRYYTRWRGSMGTISSGTQRLREDGGGEEWIDFSDSNEARFIAHCNVSLLSGAVRGYKVSDQPKFEVSRWSMRPKAPTSYVWF